MVDSLAGSISVLLAVLLLSRLAPIPLAYHPLSFFAAFCRALARKVHPFAERTASQQRLSGLLALILVLSLPLALLVGLYLLASWPLLIDAMVLLCITSWQPYHEQARKISQSLEKSLLSLAKTQARLLLLRDTRPLNQMGLVKALLESVILRFSQQLIGVIFWYLLAGAAGALCYRLTLIAGQQWSVKLTRFQQFGKASAQLQLWLSSIPYLLSSGLFWLQRQKSSKAAQLLSQSAAIPPVKLKLLAHASRTLQVSLAGPVYYQQQLVRRTRLQQKFEPDIADLKRLLKLQQHQLALLVLVLSAVALISTLLA